MKKLFQILILVLAVFVSLVSDHIALAQDMSTILYHYTGQTLRDSKWGKIALFQEALSKNLQDCKKKAIRVDGKFGQKTQTGLMILTACPNFEDFAVPPDDPLYGTIHTALWEKLLPNIPIPTVHERAFVLSLSHEDTDYDQVQWNYDTSDDKSALTWGPYGATVGHGQEVQGILRKINNNDQELLINVFGEEFPTVRKLIGEGTDGHTLLKEVYGDIQRRKDWIQKFKTLGTHEKVREHYELYAKSDKWLKSSIMRLYSLIPNGISDGTEIDYAFFLDNAIHMSITTERVEKCKNAIDQMRRKLGRNLTSAERRQVISLNLIPSMQQDDRLGRNVVYYVDGIGINKLSQKEEDVWRQRTGRKASNCGLSDDRTYNPDIP